VHCILPHPSITTSNHHNIKKKLLYQGRLSGIGAYYIL
jgi:hypothetical protein